MKSAVEMTPRGKRGKLKKRVSHSSHRAWKSGKEQRRRISTFPPRRRRGSYLEERGKHEGKTKFRLTDPVTSSTITAPASLRSDRDHHGVGMSDRNQIGITDHLHRNQQFNCKRASPAAPEPAKKSK